MTPAMLLPVEPGDRVLDFMRGARRKEHGTGGQGGGKGALISNDISNSRAKALLKNLELWGIANICVTSETPDKLAGVFGPWFDKILIDAPCSGEGMFRKDEDMVKKLRRARADYRQDPEGDHGPGSPHAGSGRPVAFYSTCTFSPL